MELMKILSLGWGVQSFTLVAMAALGEIEKPMAAIHADTGHEASWIYGFARRWTGWLELHGVQVVTVKPPLYTVCLGENNVVDIPAYTISAKTGNGKIRRQCTGSWKIDPMRRWCQAHRNGEQIEMWLGISIDEALRMKPSNRKYITNRWPLIEFKMSRVDCERWLIGHNLEVPQKSSCRFCPFHSDKEWRKVKDSPDDWREAIMIDKAIRKARPPFDLFVHRNRMPLEVVDLRTAEEQGQIRLWDEECSGICGI